MVGIGRVRAIPYRFRHPPNGFVVGLTFSFPAPLTSGLAFPGGSVCLFPPLPFGRGEWLCRSGNFDPRLLSKFANRFGKRGPVDLLNKTDGVAMLAAAEAFESIRIDMKRRRFLAVERAAPHMCAP